MLEELIGKKKMKEYYIDIFFYLKSAISDIDDLERLVDNVFKKAAEQKIEGDVLEALKNLAYEELIQYFLECDFKFKIYEKDFADSKMLVSEDIPLIEVVSGNDLQICIYRMRDRLSFYEIASILRIPEKDVRERYEYSTMKLINYFRERGKNESRR